MKKSKEKKKRIIKTVFIPDKIEIEKLIENNKPNFNYKLDFFYYLISLVIKLPAWNKKFRRKDGFVPLNSQKLQFYNREYRLHLDFLVENKVFDEFKHFQDGVSRKFRISEEYLCDKVKEIELKNTLIVRKLLSESNINLSTINNNRCLFKWFDSSKLTIENNEATQFAYSQLEEEKNKFGIYGAYGRLYQKIYKIRCIDAGYFWFSRNGKKNKRLHTNLTSLNKDLRQFLRYNGEKLVCIDIANSQPFFSTHLFYSKSLYYNNNIITLVKASEIIDTKEFEHYINLCSSGRLYEYIAENMAKEFGINYFDAGWDFDGKKKEFVPKETNPRKKAKKAFFEVVFSKNERNSKEKELFMKLFPTVMKVFKKIKEKHHNKLALMLQNLESEIVLDKTCKEIAKDFPEIPIFTIHDSISTTLGYEEIVYSYLRNNLEKAIGLNPSLKFEY